MDRESFLDVVKQQYADELHEAYLQCEHEDGKVVDYTKLSTMVRKLMSNARVEGLAEKEFEDLLKSTLPGVWDKLEIRVTKKAA